MVCRDALEKSLRRRVIKKPHRNRKKDFNFPFEELHLLSSLSVDLSTVGGHQVGKFKAANRITSSEQCTFAHTPPTSENNHLKSARSVPGKTFCSDENE